jgi:hypothetical protein
MRTRDRLALAAVAALAVGTLTGQPTGRVGATPTVARITLAAEEDERLPFAVPTDPANTVELDFPWPVEDWAGRGFTPDPERFAGDFVIAASRGGPRVFVTPVAAGAHRVLHVVLALPKGQSRSVAVEFLPAPAGLAWQKVVFLGDQPPPDPGPPVSLSAGAPRSPFREPSPDSELGLATTLRLMLNTTEAGARAVAACNPALQLAVLEPRPRSFGDFTLTPRFAVRDSTTDSLGICVSVANATQRRLIFDPTGWIIRAGLRVYPVGTVDFPGELEPGAEAPALLVLGRGPDGAPTRLLPDNAFEVSAILLGSVNPRPVKRVPLAGLEPR